MKSNIFKTFVLSLLLIAQVHFAYSQTAALLPNASQVYLDNNGKPLSSGTVGYYIPGTFTPKMVWQDDIQTTPWTNPITLNAAGRPPTDKGIYGNGTYRQIVKDRNNNIIWDQPTSATGSGGGAGTNVGDGNLVGTILPWAGMIAPAQYQFAYGQTLSRVTFANLLTAITLQTAISCTGGNATITGIADTSSIPVGAALEATCVVAGSTVISKTLTTVTLSTPANITQSPIGRFFPWGNGNGTTTFNVPDLRGVTLAGRPNMGGVDKGNLTATYYGSNPLGVNAVGGSESKTLTSAQIPAHNHPVFLNDPGHTHTFSANSILINGSGFTAGGGSGFQYGSPTTLSAFTGLQVRSATAGGGVLNQTADNIGGGSPHSVIQPTTTTNYVIKVTSDVSGSIATGVASIDGMIGALTCGSGLLCTGNTLSVIVSSNVSSVFGRTGAVTAQSGDYSFSLISGTATLSQLATQAANTVVANSTAGVASPTAISVPSCGTASSALTYTLNVGFGCNTISGSGTVNSGTINQMAYYAATGTAVSGNPNVTVSTAAMRLGVAGSAAGTLLLSGSTSGTVTLAAQATAGTPTVTWGTSSGTPAVTVSSPLALSTTTGNLTITGSTGTVLAGSAPAFTATPILGVAGSVLGTLTLAGSTSGNTVIQPKVAASGTLTLPAATDTLVGKATVDIFTNKTYDTAGAGNSLSINSLAVTANTGTGAIARAASPTFTGTLTAATIVGTTFNGNTWTTGTSTLTGTAGKTLSWANTLNFAGTDSTTHTFPSVNSTVASLNINDQTLAGGANVTSLSQSAGSITIDCGARPLQYQTNNGAFTLTAPINDGSCILLTTNGASAGTITFSGFSQGSNSGDPLTLTNTSKFSIHIWRINGTSGYRVAAHQ